MLGCRRMGTRAKSAGEWLLKPAGAGRGRSVRRLTPAPAPAVRPIVTGRGLCAQNRPPAGSRRCADPRAARSGALGGPFPRVAVPRAGPRPSVGNVRDYLLAGGGLACKTTPRLARRADPRRRPPREPPRTRRREGPGGRVLTCSCFVVSGMEPARDGFGVLTAGGRSPPRRQHLVQTENLTRQIKRDSTSVPLGRDDRMGFEVREQGRVDRPAQHLGLPRTPEAANHVRRLAVPRSFRARRTGRSSSAPGTRPRSAAPGAASAPRPPRA